MLLALAGNQNCGKTTLFNQLTGSNQHVGNFPGVTVEQKSGAIRGHEDVRLVDLPGIYSLRPYSGEEIVTRDFLINEKPDGVINIVDASNLERNLYLTLQLIELGKPMVLALNMMDEVYANGGAVDVNGLSSELGIPVVPISAIKRDGLEDLVALIIQTAENKRVPERLDFCSGAVHRCIHAITHLVEDHAEHLGIPPRFAATKLVEGDKPMAQALDLDGNELDAIEHAVTEMERDTGLDRNAALADMRYTYIEELCAKTLVKARESKEYLRSVKIDSVLTHKILALPIFLSVMFMVFWLTFGVIGQPLSDLMGSLIEVLAGYVGTFLDKWGVNPVVHSLVIDGVFTGVGSVLSFLPLIITLFFFLSILEDSGYMARVAFVMDRLLRKIGLSGRSFVPLLVGFGCTVPAVMATRTLSSDRDRKMTILLAPFMSCSAKVPIYAVFTAAFFQKRQALVMISLYIFGIVIAIICGLVLNRTGMRGKPIPFVMELPNYRLPSARTVLLLMWEKAKDFITRAFTVIFLATLVIWFLQTFNYQFNIVDNSEFSLLGTLGRAISPIFSPLGFSDWRAATALISGFTAKEAVVSSLAVLMGTSLSDLGGSLSSLFTPLSAYSYLVFTLLYTPCVAAVAAVRREWSGKAAVGIAIFQCGIAWVAAMLVYQAGRLLTG